MLVAKRGFSVIELMVVLAILGILASLAAPAFNESIASTRVKTVASDIHLSLLRARSEAIKRNNDVTVAASAGDWKSGWTITNSTISSIIERHAATTGTLSITGATSITYVPSGRASATVGGTKISISSADTQTERCISIILSGQPVITREACS